MLRIFNFWSRPAISKNIFIFLFAQTSIYLYISTYYICWYPVLSKYINAGYNTHKLLICRLSMTSWVDLVHIFIYLFKRYQLRYLPVGNSQLKQFNLYSFSQAEYILSNTKTVSSKTDSKLIDLEDTIFLDLSHLSRRS